MLKLLALLVLSTSVYAGFNHWPLYWLLALTIGVWLSQVLTVQMYNMIRYGQRWPVFSLVGYYLVACIGVAVTYGIGRLASSAFS